MLVIETLKMPKTGDGPADTDAAGTGDGDRGAGDAGAGVETRPVFALGDAVGRRTEAELGACVTLGAWITLGADDELLGDAATWTADSNGGEGRVARAAHVAATATTTPAATAALPGPTRRRPTLRQGTRPPAIRISPNPLMSG